MDCVTNIFGGEHEGLSKSALQWFNVKANITFANISHQLNHTGA